MWVISGPFDEDEPEKSTNIKSKLLKSGKEYGVGRKEQPLLIRSKKVSHRHANFIVDQCTEDDAMNPTFVPKLVLEVFGKPRQLKRAGVDELTLNPGKPAVLQHSDTLIVVSGVEVKITWKKVCCYTPAPSAKLPFSLQSCASLGVSVVVTPQEEVTHHLTPTYNLSPTIAVSLISAAHFVKPDWLTELLALGESEGTTPSSLEQNFAPPATSKHRPAFSPTLPAALRTFHVWEPDEARMGMFRPYRFIFIGERGWESQEMMREVIKRGEGEYECFAVDGGKQGLHQVLSKGKGKGKVLVLVAGEDSLVTAIGNDGWQQLKDEADSFDSSFIPPERILEAVVRADAPYLASKPTHESGSSPLPDVIPNTIPDEPSFPPEAPEPGPPEPSVPRRKLSRRATSRASSRAPSPSAEAQPEPAEAPKPRRALVRRAGRSKTTPILGIDDPSIIFDEDSARGSAEPEAVPRPTVAPTPSRPSRLKRRVGTTQMPSSQLLGLSENLMIPETEEPPLKKYKPLFEASDPDRVAETERLATSQFLEKQSVTQSESQTQHPRRTQFSGKPLVAVEEEEEEDSTVTAESQVFGSTTQGTKRKSRATSEDVEMTDGTEQLRAKKRAIEDVNAVQPSTTQRTQAPLPSIAAKSQLKTATQTQKTRTQKSQKTERCKSRAGAGPAKPDTDQAFLKAVASTKRGKKSEDTFDREFNNLRISKPDLEHEEQQKEWDVLDDFGDDRDLRGNFMVIMQMDVPEHKQEPLRRGQERMDWEGRADFKKFKRKAVGQRRPTIELVAKNTGREDDSELWGESKAQSQAQLDLHFPEESEPRTTKRSQRSAKSQSQGKGKGKGKTAFHIDDDDFLSDEEQEIPKSRGKAQTQTRTRGKKQPLFIESDEDPSQPADVEMRDANSDDEDEELTLHSTGLSKSQATTKSSQGRNKQHVILDDDSDDGAIFKGFGRRRR